MQKTMLKRVIDVLMTIGLLFASGYQFWGETLHEWIGAGMFLLFILHHCLNWRWYQNLFRGKYTPMRILQVLIDTLTLVAMLLLMYSGIVLSRHVFAFLPIDSGLALARRLHILGSYWGFMLMSLHLGLHWNMVLGAWKKRMAAKEKSKVQAAIPTVLGLLVAIYGVIAFVKRDFAVYLLLQSEFVFLDYEEPVLLFYIDYVAIMGLCIFLGHVLAKGCRKLFKGNKALVLSLCLTFFLTACGNPVETLPESSVEPQVTPPSTQTAPSQEVQDQPQLNVEHSNILIAYFTWAENTVVEHPEEVDTDATTSASVLLPGNAARLAGWIQERTGGDLFSIVVTEPYSSDYDECLGRAADEKAENARPELVNHVENMEEYDTIFLGFPNWWYTVPMAIHTFLEEYDFSGKTIVPFVTHGTGGLSGTIRDMTATLPEDVTILDAVGIYRLDVETSQPVMNQWLDELGFVENQEDTEMDEAAEKRIVMTLEDASGETQTISIVLLDNPTADALYEMLPLELNFEDYNEIEKISYLTETLPTEDSPNSHDPEIGDFCLYAPWGNLSVFYEDFRLSQGLVPLGHLENGIETITAMDSDFTVTLEVPK